MRADTHDGPEQIADTLMQLSRSLILEVHLVRTAGPYIVARSGGSHFWARGALSARTGHASSMFGIVPRLRGRGSCQLDASKKNWLSLEPGRAGSIRDAARSRTLSHCTGKLLTPSRGHGWAIY